MKKLNFFAVILMAGLVSFSSLAAVNNAFAADKKETVKKAPKYVASSQSDSKLFHVPSCSAAKNMKPENVVGFASKQEAVKAGYTAHDCVTGKPAKK